VDSTNLHQQQSGPHSVSYIANPSGATGQPDDLHVVPTTHHKGQGSEVFEYGGVEATQQIPRKKRNVWVAHLIVGIIALGIGAVLQAALLVRSPLGNASDSSQR